jgi:hypothetical protein
MERIAQMVIVPVVQATFRASTSSASRAARAGSARPDRLSPSQRRLALQRVRAGASPAAGPERPGEHRHRARAHAARSISSGEAVTHVIHLQVRSRKCHAGQGVVAVQHHVRGVDLGH